MIRRDFCKTSLALAGFTLGNKRVGALGNPAEELVADKFRGNAEFAKWPIQKAESVIELVKSLESVPDVSRLTAALSG